MKKCSLDVLIRFLLPSTLNLIFDFLYFQKQLPPIKYVQDMFSDIIFQVQLRKAPRRGYNSMHASLPILSYIEKEHMFNPMQGWN